MKRLVHVYVSPALSCMDDPVTIKVTNARPGQKVTLKSQLMEDDVIYASQGHYTVDTTGCVDVTESPSAGGSFTGMEF